MTNEDWNKQEKEIVERIQFEVLKKLNPRNSFKGNKIISNVQEYEQIYALLENTFKLREGKSAIVIGPRGVGKSFLIENALYDLKNCKKYEFFTIRLNGSYFKDDSTAIKEIARQLDWYLEQYNPSQREKLKMATFEQSTVTNTMNVIIDILDRTRLNEDNENDDDDVEEDEKEGEVNNDEIAKIYKNKSNKSKTKFFIPIVFIIDEIDRYTHSTKQTLLYNLFDIAQSSSSKTGGDKSNSRNGTTISVIGISTKATVREQLEKRVKSRFSQRIIQINKIRDLEEFCQCIYSIVIFDDNEINKENNNKENEHLINARKIFNFNIKKYIFEKSQLRKLIVENFYTIKDLNAIKNELIVFIMNNFEELMYNHLKDFKNRNIEIMKTLSETELKLLISCCRAKIKNNIFQINFDMAFDEYYKMMLKERRDIQSKIQVIGMTLIDNENNYLLDRDAIQICWERLCNLGLLDRQPMTFYGLNSNTNNARNSRKDENGRIIRTISNGNNGNNRSGNHKNIIGSAIGSITPNGVVVCGIELDDINAKIFSTTTNYTNDKNVDDANHDANTTESKSWGWLETWCRVAQ